MRKRRFTFKNTEVLNQVDWETEIVDPNITKMSDDFFFTIPYDTEHKAKLKFNYNFIDLK